MQIAQATEALLLVKTVPRRFSSIDFLRGLAIFMMLILHVIMISLNRSYYFNRLNDVGIIQFTLLLGIPFIGGLAGLFLLVSAMGNMVSITRNLDKGYSPNQIILKQVIGGFLIIFFAMLTEAVIGYHGAIGNLIYPIDEFGLPPLEVMKYRAYHFETIHTIGWAIVINGTIHGILVQKYNWKQDRGKIEKLYLALIVLTLLLTPIAWAFVSFLVPGFPFAINPKTGIMVQYPYIGISPWYDFITYFFYIALAGHLEPIFPYLAVSFLGSILGMTISQPPELIPKNFLTKYFLLGINMFIIGLAGVFFNVGIIILNHGIDAGIGLYINLPDHRYWVPYNGVKYAGWLFQFLFLNGFSLMLAVLSLRYVEFRGISKEFAEKTRFIRRFGFIAFTIYAIQYLCYFPFYFISYLIYGQAYHPLLWYGVDIVIILSLLIFHVLMLFWERIGYIGSIEWTIGTIASYLLPIHKANTKLKPKRWWERGMLDVENVFYHPQWQNIITKETIDHEHFVDSKLALNTAIAGLFFFPFSFIAFFLAKYARKYEHDNKYQRKASLLSILGIFFFSAWFIPSLFISLSMLGVSI